VDYTERLRRLTINDARAAEEALSGTGCDSLSLDPKTVALIRVAAMVAVHGGTASFGAQADAAIAVGASVSEIVDVLVAVVPVVGLPCVVAAAPRLALALGYDAEEEAL
jgi:alkylhydroperoxidase/carboxymuconolactone decarboxylase family protein YurZ